MVNESSFEANSNLDNILAVATATISSLPPLPPSPLSEQQQQQLLHQHQEKSSKILLKPEQFSWKFFDNELTILEHLTGAHDEDSVSDNNYLEEYVINDEENLSCNQDLLISTEDHFHSPIIMSSSTITTNANRQNHSQINNNNNNNNHNNNNNSIINSINNNNNNNNNNSNINTNSNSNNNTINRLGGISGADSNCNIGNSRARTLFNDNRQGIEYATGTDAFCNNTTTTTTKTTATTISATKTTTTEQKTYDRNLNRMTGVVSFHLGLYGWRKKCLYVLILGLMLLIIVNLILTLWILKVMEFSSEGMGQLKIVAGGVQLSGQALIMDLLRASAIRSRHGQPISIESSRNFSIYTRGPSGELENHLFLGHDKLECTAKEFRINDTHGNNLFSVNQKEVTIGAHTLKIDGEGGAIFRESIQTSHVRAEAGRELRLESPTRQLNIASAKGLTLQSRAGSIEMMALDDIKLSSNEGGIRLDSSKIFIPNLRTVQPITTSSGIPSNHDHSHRVYQLCACSNGKLFLAPPHSVCAGDDSTVCR